MSLLQSDLRSSQFQIEFSTKAVASKQSVQLSRACRPMASPCRTMSTLKMWAKCPCCTFLRFGLQRQLHVQRAQWRRCGRVEFLDYGENDSKWTSEQTDIVAQIGSSVTPMTMVVFLKRPFILSRLVRKNFSRTERTKRCILPKKKLQILPSSCFV